MGVLHNFAVNKQKKAEERNKRRKFVGYTKY